MSKTRSAKYAIGVALAVVVLLTALGVGIQSQDETRFFPDARYPNGTEPKYKFSYEYWETYDDPFLN